MNKKLLIFLVIAIILIIGLGYYVYSGAKVPTKQSVPMAVVPEPTAGWETTASAQFNFELKYPDGFFDVNQQPEILTGNCNYEVFPETCPNINDIVIQQQVAAGGDINAIKSNLAYPNYWENPNGEETTINKVPYCLYQTQDAAMMHSFNSYYYATVSNNQCLVVNFATSTTNCDAYLPLEAGNATQATNYNNCVATNKNQPSILSQIVSTFKFTNK
ncbi:MAG: hypothetical protein P4L63_03165 [Candidatus Pacebacteria bacterium]|nr:hypothetical protein [Candidatus Paceibacterota bacterium]